MGATIGSVTLLSCRRERNRPSSSRTAGTRRTQTGAYTSAPTKITMISLAAAGTDCDRNNHSAPTVAKNMQMVASTGPRNALTSSLTLAASARAATYTTTAVMGTETIAYAPATPMIPHFSPRMNAPTTTTVYASESLNIALARPRDTNVVDAREASAWATATGAKMRRTGTTSAQRRPMTTRTKSDAITASPIIAGATNEVTIAIVRYQICRTRSKSS